MDTQHPLKNYKMTAQELADQLGYSIQHIRVLAMTGKLPCLKRFRRYLFDETEVYEFLKKQQLIKQSSVAEKNNGTDSKSTGASEKSAA